MQAHGFENIIFIGDSGGNQAGQKAVAELLSAEWRGKTVVAHVPEYITTIPWLRSTWPNRVSSIPGQSDNLHDDPIIALNMFIDDARSVRFDERVKSGKATINGVDISNRTKNLQLAKSIVEFRATLTVGAIKKAIATR